MPAGFQPRGRALGEIRIDVELENAGDRFMNTDCIVGPPSGDPVIGRTVLATLDPVADCADRTLTPRPESPDYPLLNLR